MKAAIKIFGIILLLTGGFFFLSSFIWGGIPLHTLNGTTFPPTYRFPYRQAGLTERQAAAHLISRFTYGAQPGEVDAVVRMGLENWFARQMEADLPDDSLQQCLSRYDALTLTNEEVENTYPKNGQVIRMAVRDGIIDKDSIKTDRKAYREILKDYMQQKGFKPEQELVRQFICQKVLRAACSNNQLREVMTDFWFNHFNVSMTKNDCSEFIPAYERDIIRPSALGSFGDLLLKTAKSPAMLFYLDNFNSSAPVNDSATADDPANAGPAGKATMLVDSTSLNNRSAARFRQAGRSRGLNENYAREVMELHTLGVNGGYTQQDVTQAARVFTGWTVYPMQPYGKNLINKIGEDRLVRRGFVRDGDFLFNANRHDKGEKTVLGHYFPAGGGYAEGEELLSLLAHHPSTAAFISRKIAIRFVSDDPPAALIDRMAKTFLEKNGDIRQVLITMVSSPEFWSASALREKTKSPFELAIGAVRSLHATIDQPYQLYSWVAKMGEKKYYYQAPTGFPDKGAYWINTGSLLNRMNFGLALASGRIPGIQIDLAALNDHHEPESPEAALTIYGRLIMPERNLAATIQRLKPMLNDPALEDSSMYDNATVRTTNDHGGADNPVLAQVVGIIIGSPEYQRR
jgi:uncharacterized protein (DUF1800 family)